jgi:hypothetical protein
LLPLGSFFFLPPPSVIDPIFLLHTGIYITQNPNTTQEDVKRAAEEALKNEEAEDFPRQAVRSSILLSIQKTL